VASTLRKTFQAAGIWGLALAVVAAIWPPALGLPQLWMVVSVSILANVLQPSYRPFEGSRTPADRGTATQILWTVYLTQAAALLELVWRRRLAISFDLTTWAAFAAMSAGLALRTWAVFVLGPWFTWNVTVQAGQQLVSHGPYRLIRHPSYTGALITFVASCVLLQSWMVALLAAFALTLAFVRRIRYEEALLAKTLAGYGDYVSRTGSLLPRILETSSCRSRMNPVRLRVESAPHDVDSHGPSSARLRSAIQSPNVD
jgi:protein-S-isoprenylcysteine O-methyltransferase